MQLLTEQTPMIVVPVVINYVLDWMSQQNPLVDAFLAGHSHQVAILVLVLAMLELPLATHVTILLMETTKLQLTRNLVSPTTSMTLLLRIRLMVMHHKRNVHRRVVLQGPLTLLVSQDWLMGSVTCAMLEQPALVSAKSAVVEVPLSAQNVITWDLTHLVILYHRATWI